MNETINGTLITEKLLNISFEEWTAVTTKVEFILAMLVIWLIPLIIYIIVGACVKGGGKYYSKRMIEYANFWYGVIIWFFIQGGLVLSFIIFPFWLRFF